VSTTLTLPNMPPTIAAPAAVSAHHGDQVQFTVRGADPVPGEAVTVTAGSLPNGLSFTNMSSGLGQVSGQAEVPAGTYTMTFTVTDAHNASTTQATQLTVTREQALIKLAKTQPLAITVNKAGQLARSVTVGTTIREVTDPNGYADIGEAAPVTYQLTNIRTGQIYSGVANVSGGGVEGALTTTYTFHNLPVGVYRLHVSVGGTDYQGTADSLLTVYNAAARGGITGQGILDLSQGVVSFTVNAKYQGNGKLGGTFQYTERHLGGSYTLRSTRITGMVIVNHHVYLVGSATLNGIGGHSFMATFVDNHHLGKADKFGLQVIDGNFAPVSGATFPPAVLASGHATVLHK
jgi:hypothetical protein